MKKTTSLIKDFGLLLGCILFISACGKKNNDQSDNISPQSVSEKMTYLNWTYTSGSIGPDYQYSVSYEVDFALKRLDIIIDKGNSVPANSLPSPATKSLSDEQLTQIRSLAANISVDLCAAGPISVGGGSDRIVLSINSTSLFLSDLVLFESPCQGYTESNLRQAIPNGGYEDLTNYLKSL